MFNFQIDHTQLVVTFTISFLSAEDFLPESPLVGVPVKPTFTKQRTLLIMHVMQISVSSVTFLLDYHSENTRLVKGHIVRHELQIIIQLTCF